MKRLLLGVLVAGLLVGCTPTDGGPRTALRIVFEHLSPIPAARGHYAVWVRTAKRDLLAGHFRVDETSKLVSLDGNPDTRPRFAFRGLPDAAREVFLTQEVGSVPVQRPGKQVFLRGTFATASPFRLTAPRDPAVYGPTPDTLPAAPVGWQHVTWLLNGGQVKRAGAPGLGDARLYTLEVAGLDPATAEPGPLWLYAGLYGQAVVNVTADHWPAATVTVEEP